MLNEAEAVVEDEADTIIRVNSAMDISKVAISKTGKS